MMIEAVLEALESEIKGVKFMPSWERGTDMSMDNTVIEIVKLYIFDHLDKSDEIPEFEVFTVWKAKILQNWKYLISSTLIDGMYYEVTYNGDKNEFYLDAYKKFDNRVINGI